MIDDFDVEELKEPKIVKAIIKNIETEMDELDDKITDTNKDLYNIDDGVIISIKRVKSDLKVLDDKINDIINAQKETRKTVKNSAYSTGIGALITGIIAYVLKQLGIYWGEFMIKKLSTVELIALGYNVYFTITLFFSPELFSKEKTELYDALLLLIPGQEKWVVVGATASLLYIVLLFYRHHLYAIFVNAVGGSFMMMICVTYIFTYPNIGSGIFLFVSLSCFAQIYKISNRYENEKSEMLKRKIKSK